MAEKSNHKFQNLVLAVLFVILIGGLLKISKGIALPILAAIIWIYIITSAANALGRMPLIKLLPLFFRRLIVFLGFIIAFVSFGAVLINTIEQIIAVAPVYQENFEKLFYKIVHWLGVEIKTDWQTLAEATGGQIDAKKILTSGISGLISIGGTVSLVLIYASFLMAERHDFPTKLAAAIPNKYEVKRTQKIMHDINKKIGDYLATKTLINIILAAVSYAIMWAFDIDFPLFWALLIGLLNYIPYIGSLVAVSFPILLSVAQYASVDVTLPLSILLILVQWIVGNFLEPKMIGKRVNLSPFVVIISLSIWFGLLGIGGAILAIPLTSMLVIVMAAFAPTKPYAILLSQDIDQVVRDEK